MSRTNERHARCYIARVQETIASGDLHQIDYDLPNLQRGWAWVCEQSNDVELLLEYGSLAWRLFDMARERLYEATEALEQLQLSGPKALILRTITDKLDEILRSQGHIQTVLESNSSYSVHIERAIGVVIGDQTRVEFNPSQIET